MDYFWTVGLLVPKSSNSFDWYIDSVNGNDANTGKSAGQAFATISAINGKICDNAKIGLAKGSHFRDSLFCVAGGPNPALDNLTVDTYGSGTIPIIDCSDIIPASSWSKTVGQTNVYQASLTINTGYADQFVRAWEDDSPMIRASSVANCDATPNSYIPSADTTTPIVLYIHTSDSGDPAANGKVYEYNHRGAALRAEGSGWEITGIETRRNLGGGGSLVVGESHAITDVICRDGTKHNIYVGDGCTLTDVHAIDQYYTSPATLFVYNQDAPGGKGLTFKNCSVTRPTTTTLAGNNALSTGFYGHKNLSGDFGAILCDGCSVDNCYTGFNGQDATSITIQDCSVANYSGGQAVVVQATAAVLPLMVVRRLSVTGTIGSHPIAVTSGTGGTTILIDSCNIQQTGLNAAVVNVAIPNITLTIQDCVLWFKYQCVLTTAAASGLVLTSNRNDFRVDYNYANAGYTDVGTSTTYIGDYNTYRVADNNKINNVDYANLVALQATGQDTHSIFVP